MRPFRAVVAILFVVGLFLAVASAVSGDAGDPEVSVIDISFSVGGEEKDWGFIGDSITINVTVKNTEPEGANPEVLYTARGVAAEVIDGEDNEVIATGIELGDLAPQEETQFEVNWTVDGPLGGHYIRVELDPDFGSQSVDDEPELFTVENAQPYVEFDDDEREMTITSEISYRFLVRNDGTVTDTFMLSNSSVNRYAWEVTVEDDDGEEISSVELDPDDEIDIYLNVKIKNAGPKDEAKVFLIANSSYNVSKFDRDWTLTRAAAQILVVADEIEESDGEWRYYTEPLEENGFTFNTWFTDEDDITDDELIKYETVIWVAPLGTLSSDEQDALETFLDAGIKDYPKNLFISGQNICEGLNKDEEGQAFLKNWLHTKYKSYDSKSYLLEGRPGDLIGSGLTIDISDRGPGGGASNQIDPDDLDARNEADEIFMYEDAQVGAVVYESKEYDVVTFGFGFEAINGDNTREEIMLRILHMFQGGITGRVQNDDEEPVSNALVQILDTTFTTVSDDDGYFFFTGMAPGKYKLEATAEGYRRSEIQNAEVSKGTIDDTIRLILGTKPAVIKGTVMNQHNETVEDCLVTFEGQGNLSGKTFEAMTNASGGYITTVNEGTYDLVYEKDGYWPDDVDDVSAWEASEATVVNITIYKMKEPGYLSGRVNDTQDQGLSNIRIVIGNITKIRTGDNGEYGPISIPEGNWDIVFKVLNGTAWYNKSYGGNESDVDIYEGQDTWLNVTLQTEYGGIEGWVYDVKNNPIEEAELKLYDKASSNFTGAKDFSDDEGYFNFDNVPIGDYKVFAYADGYQVSNKVAPVSKNKVYTMEPFNLQKGADKRGSLKVNVTSNLGHGIGYVHVEVGDTGESGTTSRNGVTTISTEIPVGTHTVVFSNNSYESKSVEVEIKNNEETLVNITLKVKQPMVKGYITDQHDDPAMTINVTVSDLDGSVLTNSLGYYEFELEITADEYNSLFGNYDGRDFTVFVEGEYYTSGSEFLSDVKLGDVIELDFQLDYDPPTENQKPVADAGDDIEVKKGEEFTLDGGNSYDPDGRIKKYKWELPDGTRIEGDDITVFLDEPGTFTFELTVTDDRGDTDTDTVNVTVKGGNGGNGNGDSPDFTALSAVVVIGLIAVVMGLSRRKNED